MPAIARSRAPAPLHAAAALGSAVLAFVLGNFATIPNLGWYETLQKPTFALPNWLFGPAWTALYLLVAYAFFRVLRRPDYMPDRRGAIRAYVAQMVLGAAWSWAFFATHSAVFGLVVMAALVVAVLATLRLFFRVDRRASALFVPYLLWLVYAAALNLSIVLLNG